MFERVKCCCSLQVLHIYIYIYTVHVYTVQLILSASDESASLCALFFVPPRSHRNVRPEGFSVHRPPFGTKTVENALYTWYTLLVSFSSPLVLKKMCAPFLPPSFTGVEIRSFSSTDEKIASYAHTTQASKEESPRKRASSSRRRRLCFVTTIKKISRHPSSKTPKSTQEHARNDDDDVTMMYTRMEPLCCGRT